MRTRQVVKSAAREWLVAICAYSVLAAPFGCQLESAVLNDGTGQTSEVLSTKSVGLFINSDQSSRILMGGRSDTQDEFFVYGTRNAAGDLDEIESILVRQRNGDESFIAFESGRPVHAQGPDGSYAHVTYSEVSAQRLTANVDLFDAATAAVQHYVVDVDLQKTAAQIANLVHDLTGRTLSVPKAPTMLAKNAPRETQITIFSPLFALFVAPLIALVTITTVILGEILTFLYQAVTVAIQAVLLIVFLPLFLIADALNGVVFHVHLTGLSDVFGRTATEPSVSLRG